MIIKFITLILFSLSSQVFASSEDCQQGFRYDNTLKRCVLKEETTELKTEASECEELSGSEKQKCYEKNVQTKVADPTSKPEAKYGVPAIITLGTGYLLLKHKNEISQCGGMSPWLMFLGGATTLVGEFMSQKSYKDGVKKIESRYKKEVSTANQEGETTREEAANESTQNQVRAFDYQIEQEKLKERTFGKRKKIYTTAAGLYAAATLAAIYETYEYAMKSGAEEECSFGDSKKTSKLWSNEKHLEQKKIYIVQLGEQFKEYAYLGVVNALEIQEIVMRQIFPIAHASEEAAPDEQVPAVPEQEAPSEDNSGLGSATGGATPLLAAAGAGGGGAPASVADGAAKSAESSNFIVEYFKKPLTRVVISGLLTMYSKKVADDSKKKEKQARDRWKAIEKIKQNFIASGGSGFQVCRGEEDRRDPKKPACYCYLEDGTQNPGRKNSTVCAAIFGSEFGLKATDYDGNDFFGYSPIKGCPTKDGKIDPNCDDCKKEKSSDGKNNCVIVSGNFNLGPLASNRPAQATVASARDFVNGNIEAGQLDSGSAERLAANLENLKDKMKKSNPDLKKIILKTDNLQKKLRKRVLGSIQRASGNNPSVARTFAPSFGGGSLSSPDTNKKAIANSKKKSSKRISGGNLKKAKKSVSGFDFGDSGGGSNNVLDGEFEDIMSKDFNIDDINSNSDQNIFKIITNRYQRSGLQRLFNDKDYVPLDKANDTDIHEN